MDDPALLGAYLSYYWPVSYAQAERVMNLCDLHPLRVLDLGAGPGPMAAAAFDRGATWLCLIDHSGAALRLAEWLLLDPRRFPGSDSASNPASAIATPRASMPTTSTLKASGKAGTPTIRCIQADLEDPEAIPDGSFDLVILGHCLNELGMDQPDQATRVERRAVLVCRAAAALAPGGSVMIVDPATLASARDGMALRDHLTGRGWRIIGPCTRQGPCPARAAGENQSCHDEAAWDMPESVLRLAEGAGLDREKIKMFWLVLQPPAQSQDGDKDDFGDGDRVDLGGGDRAPSDAWEETDSDGQTYRVVSEPMLNKAGRVRYLLCGKLGRFPFSAKRNDPVALAGGFFGLKRYDLIQVESPESREGGGWGFGPETRIRMILPPGAVAGTIDP